jgi:hypothetical protein
MKKLLSIASVISVNIVFLELVLFLFNPLGLDVININYLNFTSYFSSDPVINILMILSLIGLITFNTGLVLNRRKN